MAMIIPAPPIPPVDPSESAGGVGISGSGVGSTGFAMVISLSLALLLCVWVRNQRMISSVLTVVIPIAAFLGGSYIPLSVFQSSLLDKLSMFSPIHWMNKAMFQLIFDVPNSQVYQVLFLNVILCTLCLVISTIMIKKRGIV